MQIEIGVAAALRNNGRKMRTGQTYGMMVPPVGSGGCNTGGRGVPGFGEIDPSCGVSRCKWISIAMNNAAVGAGGTAAITVTPNVTMCLQRMVVSTTGTAGFTLTNFQVNNKPQWIIGHVFHSDGFQPGADDNDNLPGDCIIPGSTLTISVTNLDGANARGIYIRLSGPSGE